MKTLPAPNNFAMPPNKYMKRKANQYNVAMRRD